MLPSDATNNQHFRTFVPPAQSNIKLFIRALVWQIGHLFSRSYIGWRDSKKHSCCFRTSSQNTFRTVKDDHLYSKSYIMSSFQTTLIMIQFVSKHGNLSLYSWHLIHLYLVDIFKLLKQLSISKYSKKHNMYNGCIIYLLHHQQKIYLEVSASGEQWLPEDCPPLPSTSLVKRPTKRAHTWPNSVQHLHLCVSAFPS